MTVSPDDVAHPDVALIDATDVEFGILVTFGVFLDLCDCLELMARCCRCCLTALWFDLVSLDLLFDLAFLTGDGVRVLIKQSDSYRVDWGMGT